MRSTVLIPRWKIDNPVAESITHLLGLMANSHKNHRVWLFFGIRGAVVAGNQYPVPGMGASYTTETAIRAPRAGTLRNLYINAGTAPGAGKSDTAKSRINGTDGNLAITLSGTNTTTQDTTNSDAVAVGDRIGIRYSGDATGSSTADVTVCVELEFAQ